MRAPTSTGLEKKNGGSTTVPKIGTVVKSCHRPSAATPTSTCKKRSLMRLTIKLLRRCREQTCRARYGPRALGLRLGESSDQPGRALSVSVERLEELVPGQAGLERFRLEVRGDQGESVVMPVAGRRAWTEIMPQPGLTLAADIFLRRAAHLAFGKAGHRSIDAIGHPVRHAQTAATLGIEHQEGIALGPGGLVRPAERRRDVLAHAIGILLVVARMFDRQLAIVLEGGRLQHEGIGRQCSRAGGQHEGASEREFLDR